MATLPFRCDFRAETSGRSRLESASGTAPSAGGPYREAFGASPRPPCPCGLRMRVDRPLRHDGHLGSLLAIQPLGALPLGRRSRPSAPCACAGFGWNVLGPDHAAPVVAPDDCIDARPRDHAEDWRAVEAEGAGHPLVVEVEITRMGTGMLRPTCNTSCALLLEASGGRRQHDAAGPEWTKTLVRSSNASATSFAGGNGCVGILSSLGDSHRPATWHGPFGCAKHGAGNGTSAHPHPPDGTTTRAGEGAGWERASGREGGR